MKYIMDKSIEVDLIKKALQIRVVEEALLALFDKGKLYGTVHTTIGQEFSAVCVVDQLKAKDIVISNHRCHGHFLAKTQKVSGLVAELMGRESGICGGVGGSQHLCADNFYSNGIQGGIVPLAAGLALAKKNDKDNAIVTVFIGDGTFGEGVLYEALNIISKWKLPVLIVVEDNKYSQSTEQAQTFAGTIQGRAEAFNIEYAKANTWDWKELHHNAATLIKKVRNDCVPILLHIETYRLAAHSKGDDLRDINEINHYRSIDPINVLIANEYAKEYLEAQSTIDNIVEKVNQDAYANILIKKDSNHFIELVKQDSIENSLYGKLINEYLNEALSFNDSLYIFGEDIEDPYGGAFKVTKGLSEKFPKRVKNFPISEGCLVGLGAGFSLSTGYEAIVEIMFGDFLTLAFDQILNHAAKYEQIYASKVNSNITIRVPMGGGRGYGPTHSQTLDKHFLGIPGLTVYALNPCLYPKEIFDFQSKVENGPRIIIENKALYGTPFISKVHNGFELLKIKTQESHDAWLKPNSETCDLTIITYGGMTKAALEACFELFEDHDVIAQCLIISKIYPMQVSIYKDIYKISKAILVVEEGQGFAGFGSELIAQIHELGGYSGKMKRLYAETYCIPSARGMEQKMLPNKELIVDYCINNNLK